MDLDSGVQILSGKLLESTFICIKPQVHIMLEPTAIIILVQRSFSVNGADTLFWPIGPCIMLKLSSNYNEINLFYNFILQEHI
jgi:hypothetical protein